MFNRKYKFQIMPKARGDLDDIFRYISGKLFNSPAANALMDEFDKGFKRICEFPFSCGELQTESNYRKLIVDNYIAFYRIDEIGERVIVFRVLYGMMDYKKHL